MERLLFDDQEAFLAKLRELLAAGVPARRIHIVTPVPVHEAMELLHTPPSRLEAFTFPGAFIGTLTGLGLTIYTVLHWPLITGGKTLVSLPPFTIIAFELTILFGALASIGGFLFLNRLPSARQLAAPEETGNGYAIFVEEGR